MGSQKGDAHGLESLQGSLNVNNKNYWFFKRNKKVFCKIECWCLELRLQEKALLAWDIQKFVGQILPPKHLYKWCTSIATGFRLRQQMCLCICLLSLRLCDTFWIYMGLSQKKQPCCPSQSLLTHWGFSSWEMWPFKPTGEVIFLCMKYNPDPFEH